MLSFRYLLIALAVLGNSLLPLKAIATTTLTQPLGHPAIATTWPHPATQIVAQEKTTMPLSVSVTIPTTVIKSAPLIAEIDAYLQAHYETGRFMGTAIVVRHGEIVFAKGYGMANLEHRVPNSTQTRFRIGSITKQFTAAAILQLQEQGKLDVQATVATYLPDYPNGDRITLHHLLTHTAGIPNLTSFPDYLEWMGQSTTLKELVDRFRDLPLEFEPGEQFRYSNSGYVLLTQVIEAVSGQPYADYLQAHLLRPLGLENTGYELPSVVIENLASGYGFTGESYQPAEHINMLVPAGAGGLYSTVGDLARWNQFLFDGDRRDATILSDESVAAMTLPYVAMGAEAPNLFYGYGLIIHDHPAHRRISHGGGINGFVSHLGGSPTLGTTIAVLSNVATANPQGISEGLAAILWEQPYELPTNPTVVAIDPALLDAYIGTYQVTPDFAVAITVESGQLHIQGTGQPQIPLYPASATEFFARILEFRIVFNTAADGTVESATLLQNGQELPAPKVD
ncbi:MAG: serine hydrolase [Leptolyngbya sp. SIOISBB]|nr:serine hydrolase [Leptolyngbya sp. SIOISBB]